MARIVVNVKDVESVVDLDELEFNNGLAISMVYRKDWRCKEELAYVGVLDECGNIILPYQAYYKDVEIFPSKNIIVKIARSNDEEGINWTEVRHYKHNGYELELLNDKLSDTYKRITNTVIRTGIVDQEGHNCMVLYDVVIAKIISEGFTTIEDFKIQPNGEELACAKTKLIVNDGDLAFYDMICYINKSGIIRTPIYNSYLNNIMIFDTSCGYRDAIKKIYGEITEIAEAKKQEKQNQKQKTLEAFWQIKM